jgi:hypothetical protein
MTQLRACLLRSSCSGSPPYVLLFLCQIKDLQSQLAAARTSSEEKERVLAAAREREAKEARDVVQHAPKPCGCTTKCKSASCGCKKKGFGCSKTCGCKCDGCFNEHSYPKNAEGIRALIAVEEAELERGRDALRRKFAQPAEMKD